MNSKYTGVVAMGFITAVCLLPFTKLLPEPYQNLAFALIVAPLLLVAVALFVMGWAKAIREAMGEHHWVEAQKRYTENVAWLKALREAVKEV